MRNMSYTRFLIGRNDEIVVRLKADSATMPQLAKGSGHRGTQDAAKIYMILGWSIAW